MDEKIVYYFPIIIIEIFTRGMVFVGMINVLTKELGNIKHKCVVAYYGEWVNWY